MAKKMKIVIKAKDIKVSTGHADSVPERQKKKPQLGIFPIDLLGWYAKIYV